MPKILEGSKLTTRGAAKAERERTAAAKPQTRSKAASQASVGQNNPGQAPQEVTTARKPRRCIACSTLADAFVEFHSRCPLKESKAAMQGEIDGRQEKLAADVQAQIAMIMANRGGAATSQPVSVPAFPPGLGLEPPAQHIVPPTAGQAVALQTTPPAEAAPAVLQQPVALRVAPSAAPAAPWPMFAAIPYSAPPSAAGAVPNTAPTTFAATVSPTVAPTAALTAAPTAFAPGFAPAVPNTATTTSAAGTVPNTAPAAPTAFAPAAPTAFAPGFAPAAAPAAPTAFAPAAAPAAAPTAFADCDATDAMQVDELVGFAPNGIAPSTPVSSTFEAQGIQAGSEHPPPYQTPDSTPDTADAMDTTADTTDTTDATDTDASDNEDSADGSPTKKNKKTYIPNVWKAMPEGDWQPLNLTRNKLRPPKLDVDKMSHAVNPKFQAVIQKAEFMSDKVDCWVLCAAMPMHGLGELRIWENEDLLRDAPDIKNTVRGAMFNALEPLRVQRLAEMKAEAKANKAKAAAAEAAMRESEKEKRKYKARAKRLEKESKRLKAQLAAKDAKKSRNKKTKAGLKKLTTGKVAERAA